jgi:hypothetical protein
VEVRCGLRYVAQHRHAKHILVGLALGHQDLPSSGFADLVSDQYHHPEFHLHRRPGAPL